MRPNALYFRYDSSLIILFNDGLIQLLFNFNYQFCGEFTIIFPGKRNRELSRLSIALHTKDQNSSRKILNYDRLTYLIPTSTLVYCILYCNKGPLFLLKCIIFSYKLT